MYCSRLRQELMLPLAIRRGKKLSVRLSLIFASLLPPAGHQKKIMLAVKKLTDLRKSLNQADANTLRRKIPGALDIVTIESVENGECHSPHTPKMTTFQDSELSYELQTAMSNSCQETLTIKNTQGISRSQESIGMRSRGSGHSQENMLSQSTTSSHSQESLGSGESSSGSSGGRSSTQPHLMDNSTNSQGRPSPESYGTFIPQLSCPDGVNGYSNGCAGSPLRERNLPEGMDQYQRPSVLKGDFLPYTVPSEPPTSSPCTSPHTASKRNAPYVFMYPHMSMKAQQPHLPSAPEQTKTPEHACAQRTTLQSTAQKAFSYLYSHCGGTEPPHVPPKPAASVTSRETQNGEGLKHKKRSHSLNRYALSDGEPEEEEPPTSSVGSYATLTRRPGRSQVPRAQPPSDAKVSRSQSFAIRARRKGPPPPPPKRLSSVSSAQAVDAEYEQGLEPPKGSLPSEDGGDNLHNMGCPLRSVSAIREGPTTEESPSKLCDNPMGSDEEMANKVGLHNSLEGDPGSTEAASGRSHPFESNVSRRRTFSEPTVTMTEALPQSHEDIQSDGDEEAQVGKDGQAQSPCSSQSSSSECIPFAEEGNLTIKQRPKPVGQLKADATVPDSDSSQAQSSGKEQGDPARETPVPEFNLTESDTVKRRPRCKEREPLQNVLKAFGVDLPSPATTTAPAPQYAQAQVVSISGPSLHMMELQPTGDTLDDDSMELQIAEIEKSILSLERGIKKPPPSLKPTSPVPLQMERHGRGVQLRAPVTGTSMQGSKLQLIHLPVCLRKPAVGSEWAAE